MIGMEWDQEDEEESKTEDRPVQLADKNAWKYALQAKNDEEEGENEEESDSDEAFGENEEDDKLKDLF